jgi:excisionase family DNA binding protein
MSAEKSVGTTELLAVPAAASFLGLSVWQVRGLIAGHSLPVVQVGRKFYLRRATLVRWQERTEGLVRQ